MSQPELAAQFQFKHRPEFFKFIDQPVYPLLEFKCASKSTEHLPAGIISI